MKGGCSRESQNLFKNINDKPFSRYLVHLKCPQPLESFTNANELYSKLRIPQDHSKSYVFRKNFSYSKPFRLFQRVQKFVTSVTNASDHFKNLRCSQITTTLNILIAHERTAIFILSQNVIVFGSSPQDFPMFPIKSTNI